MPRVTAAHEQQVRDRIVDARRVARLRREGLSPRHGRRCRPRERPVGRRDLHLLPEQGRAVPAHLRPDLGPRPRDARGPARAVDDDARSGSARRSPTTSRPSTTFEGEPGQVTPRPGLGGGRRGARRPRDARPPPRAAGRGRQLLLREGIARGELPDWLDVDGLARGLHGAARRAAAPADRGRATATAPTTRSVARPPILDVLLAAARAERPGAGHGVASAAMAARPDRPRARSTRPTSGSRCHTSTPRSRCGTSRPAGTTGSSRVTSRSSSRSSSAFRAAGAERRRPDPRPAWAATRRWLAGLATAERAPRRDGLRLVPRTRTTRPRRGHRPAFRR